MALLEEGVYHEPELPFPAEAAVDDPEFIASAIERIAFDGALFDWARVRRWLESIRDVVGVDTTDLIALLDRHAEDSGVRV